MAIRQPQTRTTAGVRQVVREVVSVFADMGGFLRRCRRALLFKKRVRPGL
jgi:hypothetical protein